MYSGPVEYLRPRLPAVPVRRHRSAPHDRSAAADRDATSLCRSVDRDFGRLDVLRCSAGSAWNNIVCGPSRSRSSVRWCAGLPTCCRGSTTAGLTGATRSDSASESVGLMCSGVGITMTVVVGVAALMRRGWRLAALHTAPLAAAFVIWYAFTGDDKRRGVRLGVGTTASFVYEGYSFAFERIGRLPGTAILFALVLAVGPRARLGVFATRRTSGASQRCRPHCFSAHCSSWSPPESAAPRRTASST